MIRKLRWFFLFLFFSSVGYSQVYHNEWIDYSKSYYKFKLFGFGTDAANAPITKGMVRIPSATISAAGLGSAPAEHFQLWRDGQEVPIYVAKNNGVVDYIEFWGEINTGKLDKELYRDAEFQLNDKWSLQTDTAAYFLTVNPGGNNLRLENADNNTGNNGLPATPYFMHTVGRYFRATLLNGFYVVNKENLYSSSYERGEGYVSRAIRPNGNSCGGNAQLPQNFTSLKAYTAVPSALMKLKVNSVGNAANSRSVRVNLNSTNVTVYQMDYFFDAKIEENVPVSAIVNDAANLTFINQSTAGCDEFRIAQIELTYPRTFNMDNSSNFELTLEPDDQGRYIEFTNFNTAGVAPVIYDLNNGKRYIGDISTAGKVKLALPGSTAPYRLVITTQAGNFYKSIAQVEKRNFVDYSQQVNQGDYLIISNPELYGVGSTNYVEQYRQYRSTDQGGKYVSQVVDINQLVDQFAWGVKKHPLSIKNFLNFARSKFSTAPKFAFLIGKGVSYNEYRANENNALIERLNLVPTFGYPASDNLLTSEDENAIPATPIGRLSAVTAQEVGDYLQKVKQYDSVQKSPVNTIEAKGWMKNVLQIAGANDLSLGKELDGYLDGYKSIIKEPDFGARVTNFSKTANPAGYTDAVVNFKNTYENGSSLITYFGHSSATSLDFNLDKPESYNNSKKYPVFIANGCTAGNHFGFETNRFNNKSTISEKFVLAKERGAIGYLASSYYGVPNYLDSFTRKFYYAFTKNNYNQPIGNAIKEGITQVLDDAGYDDFYARIHAEEYSYHGDPAIKLNATSLPDYAIEQPQIETTPSFVSVADTTFNVKVRIYNIGRATTDSVNLKVDRKFPNGKTLNLLTRRLGAINLVDSVSIKVPIIGNRDKGENILTATIDNDDVIIETTNENNTAFKAVEISEDEIRPVYPYKNAIVNNSNFKFQASTVNPLSASRAYIMEIDTTDLFSSPLKASEIVTSKGGVVEFSPGITLQNNKVYYWRVAPVVANPYWSSASFKYDTNSDVGFEQSHFYQHTKARLEKLYLDSATKQFKYTQRKNNLFIVNSIYPTSGLEDGHFSVSVNGAQIIASACDGPVLQFNVFDPVTFKPWKNTTVGQGMYGSVTTSCSPSRQYNFDFLTIDTANRRKAVKFFDTIPDGSYVVVRIVASTDNNVNSYAAKWQSDTSKYGSGNSIYHRLKAAGFATIDSFNRPRTFSFVFKKNDETFAPQYVMSDGINDRINLNVDCTTPDTLGYITSNKYGPARGWKRVKWSGMLTDNDVATLQVVGIKKDGSPAVLYNLNTNQPVFDISTVSAVEYPFIELRLKNQDSITATPYQLNYYQVEYEAAPEGGLAPNLYFNMPDIAQVTNTSTFDTLRLGVAYKNVSKVNFDSLEVKLVLYDSLDNAIEIPMRKTRPLAAGDTLHIEAVVNAASLNGLYNVYLQVGTKGGQYEQESFNNFLYKYVYVDHAGLLPVTLIDFNAQLKGSDVRTLWTVNAETNLKHYIVQHSTNGSSFYSVGKVNGINSGVGARNYEFIHKKVPSGKNYYRLVMQDKDGTTKLSPVRLITVSNGVVVNVYPNPVKDKVTISISSQAGKAGSVQLLNAFGQQLQNRVVNGSVTLDMSKYAKGSYFLKVNDGYEVKTHKIQKQ